MTSPISTERLKEILGGAKPNNEGWLIRKGGYFYRPNRSGYTGTKAEAGRYTEEEASAEHRNHPHYISAMPASEVPDADPIFDDEKRAMASELLAAREALRPFAEFDGFNDHCPDETPAWYYPTDEIDQPSEITVGDFRRARALSGNRSGE